MKQAAVELASVADDVSSGIQYSLKLVGDGLGLQPEPEWHYSSPVMQKKRPEKPKMLFRMGAP